MTCCLADFGTRGIWWLWDLESSPFTAACGERVMNIYTVFGFDYPPDIYLMGFVFHQTLPLAGGNSFVHLCPLWA